jgi:predicted dehydrogenase
VIIQVGHLERFNPAVVALRDTIQSPRFIESHRLSVYQPRGTDVSVVLDLMIHDIDIILNFVMSRVKNIHAAGIPVVSGHVDIANARLEFQNGCVANVTASRISMRTERKIRLFQRNAYISVDFANHEIVVVNRKSDGSAVICAPENVAASQNGPPLGDLIPDMEINRFCFTRGDALADELRSFVDAVLHHRRPAVTGQMGRDALEIALAIMAQIRATEDQCVNC